MNRPAQPVLTVRAHQSEGSFAPGRDVVVGSDVRADLRVAHPLIARAHLLLRFDQGRWMAIDNNSLNGMFVGGQRMPMVDIHDGQTINIGKPEGPQVTFEVGHHTGTVGQLPPTQTAPMNARPAPPRPQPAPPLPTPPPAESTTRIRRGFHQDDVPDVERTTAVPVIGHSVSAFPTRKLNVGGPRARLATPAGAARIGRATDNDIVIADVLASRHHAYLAPCTSGPLGSEIRDANSINGTFVNGIRVGSAVLAEGDVVTIGNVDLVFSGGELVRRAEAATRTGGLEVRDVGFSVGGVPGKALLQNITMTARPGTVTAIIGGSGAGKTTLSRLIAGYATPSSGSVTFEGHDIHTQYASLRTRIGMVPQDDVVHRQLTVNQALGYAAELRLPPDTSKPDRDQVVAQVLDELGLTQHANTRVDQLSGGQRKRASVALELLTGPSLLILDEPTSGLDPALDLQVMTMLRQLADAGRVVLVVTHSLTYLDVCDQVLLMAP
ncbi:ATP-binding cassette domain-containing protein, partial [Mycobacterium sp.]|uniref:ATP-binding cassette domain-containing protein n=1 Tax=Mycobacterium sp. TaxID=1785 RepID=UPI003F980DFE